MSMHYLGSSIGSSNDFKNAISDLSTLIFADDTIYLSHNFYPHIISIFNNNQIKIENYMISNRLSINVHLKNNLFEAFLKKPLGMLLWSCMQSFIELRVIKCFKIGGTKISYEEAEEDIIFWLILIYLKVSFLILKGGFQQECAVKFINYSKNWLLLW